jgi:hypothetical protein
MASTRVGGIDDLIWSAETPQTPRHQMATWRVLASLAAVPGLPGLAVLIHGFDWVSVVVGLSASTVVFAVLHRKVTGPLVFGALLLVPDFAALEAVNALKVPHAPPGWPATDPALVRPGLCAQISHVSPSGHATRVAERPGSPPHAVGGSRLLGCRLLTFAGGRANAAVHPDGSLHLACLRSAGGPIDGARAWAATPSIHHRLRRDRTMYRACPRMFVRPGHRPVLIAGGGRTPGMES